jgi:S-formylglutathione hydrolase FrmB
LVYADDFPAGRLPMTRLGEGRMLEVSLLKGWVPFTLTVSGVLGLAWLCVGRGRRWWLVRLPIAGGAAAIVTAGAVVYVEKVWRPFPDPIPLEVALSVGVALFAVGLAAARWPSVRGWWRWNVLPLCVVLVVVAAASAVNVFYGQYPSVGAVVGAPIAHQVDLGRVNTRTGVVAPSAGRPLAAAWRAPADLPAHGDVAQVSIPGVASRFPARPGLVYLPPAYLVSPRAELPVLVLLAGTPGSPRDWFDAGGLAERADRFAAAHHGLAPVVVVPDILGNRSANPLCVDSRLGKAATYVDVDVPAWIKATLQVNSDTRTWAVGGLSSGGTCALQAVVRSSRTYPTLVDLSGQDEPTLATRKLTVDRVFGGDLAAFHAINPLEQLSRRRLPGVAAMVAVGDHDKLYRPEQERVARALQRAGIPVQFELLPGGHSWHVWGPGLGQAMPWLSRRMGLI